MQIFNPKFCNKNEYFMFYLFLSDTNSTYLCKKCNKNLHIQIILCTYVADFCILTKND